MADLPTQWNQRVVEAEAKCDAGLQAVSASVHEVEDVVINNNRQHAAEQMKTGKETQLQADAELALRKRVQEVQAQCAQALAEAQQAWKTHADAAAGRLETLQLAEESCELRVAACEDALLAHSREVDRLAADADALAVRMGSPGTPTRPRLMEQMVQLVNNRAASPLRPPPPMSTLLQPTATATATAATVAVPSSASPQSPGSPGRKSLKERIGERLASTQGSPRGSPLTAAARLSGHEASLAQAATQASPRPAPLLMAVSAFSASLSPPGRAPVSPLGNPAQRLDTATQMSPLLQQPGSPRPGSPATGLAATAGATPIRSPRPRISDRIAAAVQEMQSRSAGTTPVGSPTTTAARPQQPGTPLGSTAGSTGSPRVPLSERIHAIQTQAGSPQLKPTRTEPAPAVPPAAVPSSEYGGMKLSERLAAEQGTDPLSPQVPVSPLLPHHAFSPAAAGFLHGSDLAERVAALEGAEAERKKADCDLQDSLAKLEEVVRLVAGGAGGHPEVQGIIDKVYHLDEDVRYLRDAVGVADGGVGGDGDIRNLKRRLDFLEEQQLDMRQGIHRLGSSGIGGGGGGGVGGGGGAPRSVKRLREGSIARSVGGRAGSGGAVVDVGRLYSGGGQSSPVLEAIHASVNRLRDMSPLRQRAEPAGVASAAAAAAAGVQSLYGVSTPASSIAVATAAAVAAADYRAAMTVNATSAAAAAAALPSLPLSTPSSVARTPYADSLLTSQYYAPPTVQPSASRYSTAAASVLPAYSPPPVHDVTEGLFD